MHRNAELSDQDWTAATGSLLVVGDTEMRVEAVTLVLAGWPVAPAGALLVLEPLDPPPGAPARAEVVVQGTPPMATVCLSFARTAPRRYRLAGDVYLGDDVIALAPAEHTAEVLMVAPPTGGCGGWRDRAARKFPPGSLAV